MTSQNNMQLRAAWQGELGSPPSQLYLIPACTDPHSESQLHMLQAARREQPSARRVPGAENVDRDLLSTPSLPGTNNKHPSM